MPLCARAASPWLPESGRLGFTASYIDDSFRDFRYGSNKARLADPYKQNTVYLGFEYGLKRDISIDVETGYTHASAGKISIPGLIDNVPRQGLGGVADSLIGVRWQFLRIERTVFTVRGAALVKGSYDLSQTNIFSPGDKASGALGSVLMGNSWKHGFYSFSEIGFRYRQTPVPNEFFGTAGGGITIRRFSAGASYQTARSINGVDIFAPGFTLLDFPATKKVFGSLDFTGNYTMRSGVSLGAIYGRLLEARNFGMKRILGLTVAYTFPGKGPYIGQVR